jgi:hypothetical protein
MADDQEVVGADIIDKELFSREIPIAYYGTEDIVGLFADQAMVSHSTGLFTLLFFQMQVPPTTDVEDLRKLDKLPARCVAKIVLTPQLMEQFNVAMETNIKKHKKFVSALEKGKE